MSFSVPEYAIDFKGMGVNQDHDIGQRYFQTGHIDVARRPTFSELTAFHQTKLFRIIENDIKLYCGRPQCMTAGAACNQYRQYIAWEQRLPPQFKEAMTVGDAANPPLPHVFYL